MGRLPAILSQRSWEWRLLRHAMLLSSCVVLLDMKSESVVREALPDYLSKQFPTQLIWKWWSKCFSGRVSQTQSKHVHQISYAGHICPAKGIRELVEACRLINGIAFELNLVGSIEDSFRAELLSIAAEAHQTSWLHFRGTLARIDAMGFIRDADLFVLPSHTEGFPIVVLEAMALRKPIVATNVWGNTRDAGPEYQPPPVGLS